MSRRSVNPGRLVSDGGLPTIAGLLHPKSRSPPVLTIALLVLGVIVLIAYFNSGSGGERRCGLRCCGKPGTGKRTTCYVHGHTNTMHMPCRWPDLGICINHFYDDEIDIDLDLRY